MRATKHVGGPTVRQPESYQATLAAGGTPCFHTRSLCALHGASAVVQRPLMSRNLQEDDVVRRMVALHGARQWSVIAEQLPGRVGKQCRERCDYHSCSLHRPT